MREIKFRGLNEETNEWVYGWYTKLIEGARRIHAIVSDANGELTRFYIHDPETIGQYTGLKDSSGTEIYEGDIIRVLYTDWPSKSDGDSRTLEQYKKDISNNGVIEKYKHGHFVNFGLDRFREVCRGMIDHGKHGEIEIIGNINENPELMENK